MTSMEKYVETLRSNGLKVTPQRLEVLRYLDENRTHPTVEQIHSALKEKNPSLSMTTVYNTVETLTQHHIIQSLTITGSELRYDFETKMHHHFLCTKCNRIIDIYVDCPYLHDLMNGAHRVEEVHGYFKGICADCLALEEGD